MSPKIIASLTLLRDSGKLRWYAGMLTTRHGRVLRIETHRYDDGAVFTALFVPFLCDDADEMAIPDDDAIPDTDDPLTAAAFLLMAQEAWGETAHLVRFPTHTQPAPGQDLEPALWWALAVGLASVPLLVYRDDGTRHYLAGPTRIEALIAAILAAPEKA